MAKMYYIYIYLYMTMNENNKIANNILSAEVKQQDVHVYLGSNQYYFSPRSFTVYTFIIIECNVMYFYLSLAK